VGTYPSMMVHTSGEGEDLLLFHGGMGSWRHWVRNIEELSQHFCVHALDLPGYGDSAAVRRKIPAQEYFDFVYEQIDANFGGTSPLRAAGFSFGSVVASAVLPRFGARLRGFSLIGPSGFGPPKRAVKLATRSYREANGDPAMFDEIARQNLLAVMLLHPASVDEQALRLQRENIELHKGMNSSDVSILDIVPDALGKMRCPVQLIYGEKDQVARKELEERIARCQRSCPDIDVTIIPNTGHWAMYEAPEVVNSALVRFHGAA
jgi:2-hydroxy-6-oxonona-2,4-dienedioate hydrolase